jgi:hypothetical protein
MRLGAGWGEPRQCVTEEGSRPGVEGPGRVPNGGDSLGAEPKKR